MIPGLFRLAELEGIACTYADVWGHEQAASETVLVKLLVALGALDAGDVTGRSVQAAIAVSERRRRTEVLPPVFVLRDDDPVWPQALSTAAANASAGDATGAAVAWRIDAEDGSVWQGEPGAELSAAPRPPLGYHRLALMRGGQALARCKLIVAPRTAYQPPALQGSAAVWGVAAQLYSLRSERNWGIGDFTDLLRLIELAHQAGASFVGVNPLHAMFPHNPDHISPYSPSSRLFLNVAYLDVEAIPEFAESIEARDLAGSAQFRARLDRLRSEELVDYAGVAAAKAEVLHLLYAHFRREHLVRGSARAQAFEQFRRDCGTDLRRHALFEALQEFFHRDDDAVWGWPVWPEPYRSPASEQVAAFEREHAEAVEFYEYLQWQAEQQLDAIGRRWRELGMAVGLYIDLAVSIDRAGAESWSEQALYSLYTSVGAPPDDYNPKGQNWGLPPIAPARLRAAAYAPFIATLRENMQHAGALRIDHVMALMRLYWVPPDCEASDGAYVHYPFDDLLAIVALESRRNRCLVIGEDLGTVPEVVRTKMATAGVFSYRVLLFERSEDGEFKQPAEYPAHAIACASTHDLPTLAGWWQGRDLDVRTGLGLLTPEAAEQQSQERARDRARLLRALAREQLLPPDLGAEPRDSPKLDHGLMCAAHRYLARSPAQLVAAQLEDVLLATDSVNLPGTTDRVPNWRRKLPLPLERWAGDSRFNALAQALREERPAVRRRTA